jgi:hypothetical protein
MEAQTPELVYFDDISVLSELGLFNETRIRWENNAFYIGRYVAKFHLVQGIHTNISYSDYINFFIDVILSSSASPLRLRSVELLIV